MCCATTKRIAQDRCRERRKREKEGGRQKEMTKTDTVNRERERVRDKTERLFCVKCSPYRRCGLYFVL